jgi:hypothetical protein
MENPNSRALDARFAALGASEVQRQRLFSTIYASSPSFRPQRDDGSAQGEA